MIQTVNDLRNALMFDMETDSDLAACEATCEIADYALEATLAEYRDGNIDLAALEAADAAASNADDSKWNKIKTGILNWIKAAAQTIRSVLTRIQNFVVKHKALNAAKKLSDRDPNAKYGSVNVDESIVNALEKGFTVDPTKKVLDVVKAAVKDNNVIAVKADEFYNPGDPTGKMISVSPMKAKGYLNGVAAMLSSLNKTFPKVDAIMKDLKNEGDVAKKRVVRNSITACYNAMSSAARDYFHAAVSIANDLCKSDKSIDKEIDKANATRAKETSKAVGGKNEKQRNKAWEKANAQRNIAKKYNLAYDAAKEAKKDEK